VTTKRFLSGLALVGALVLVAGCGGEPFPKTQAPTPSTIVDGGKSPHARLLAAVERVSEQKTARISMNMTFSASGSVVRVTATGAVDFVARRMQLTIDPFAGQESPIEMRLVGGTMYSNAGSGWQRMSPATAAKSETPDPTSYLDYLQGVADNVRVEGTAVVRGVYTTRYSATIDLARALTRAHSAAQRSSLAIAQRLFGTVQIPAKVWIDEQGQLRKASLSIDLSATTGALGLPVGSHPKIAETLELYDFGVAVDVQAPAGAIDAKVAAQDRAAQSDLRNALTAEKTVYTDNMEYNTTVATMKAIEPSLDWGGKLSVVVGSADGQPNTVVCLSEVSKSGTRFALADVGVGPGAGTYYAKTSCPSVVNESSFATFQSRW
jgi:hypothetical protein